MTLGPLMMDVAGLQLDAEDRELLQHPSVGGVILFSRNYASREQVRALTKSIKALRSPSLLIAVDQEGGRVQRFRDDFTELPNLRWLGHLYDADARNGRAMASLSSRLLATELGDVGVDFSFTPCLDLDRGMCEVIGDRAVHSKPGHVAALGLAIMQGLRQAGMAAVAKHFPGHGGVTGDSHHCLPEDRRSSESLLDDMRPYSSLISDGLQGVMMAHVLYPKIDSEIASFSPYWMRQVLRRELGFKGAIFSDDLSMAGAVGVGSHGDRARIALEAGADMVLLCNDRANVGPVLEALEVHDNAVAHARLAAMRFDRAKYAGAAYGSAQWRTMQQFLLEAMQPPEFKLDGS